MVVEEFAAVVVEGGEVEVVGGGVAGIEFVGELDRVVGEFRVVPCRVVEEEVADELGAEGGGLPEA